MKSGLSPLFLALLTGVAPPVTATAQTIPVDHFEGLRFDAPVPALVRSGQQVPLSGDLLDSTWQEALFSFRPVDGGEPVLDFFVQHLPGRIQRTLVFAEAQADTYEVVLFAGGDDDGLQFRGVFSPFVVLPASGGVQLPVRFFDGFLLDAPLATEWVPGGSVALAGQVLDDRILSARFDLSRQGVELESVRIPLEGDRFDLPLRFPVDSPGPVLVELVVGLRDGTFWGRGSFVFEITGDATAQAAPTVLAAALLPGGQVDIGIGNRGGADLRILDAVVPSPFEVISLPAPIPPGQTGIIGVRYAGTGGMKGTSSSTPTTRCGLGAASLCVE